MALRLRALKLGSCCTCAIRSSRSADLRIGRFGSRTTSSDGTISDAAVAGVARGGARRHDRAARRAGGVADGVAMFAIATVEALVQLDEELTALRPAAERPPIESRHGTAPADDVAGAAPGSRGSNTR